MFNVLIDTCVWLDLADKPQQTPLVDVLEALLSYGGVNLLLPQIVKDEFAKNRPRVAEKSTKGLSTHFNLVKDAVRRSDRPKRVKDRMLSDLSDVDHKLPQVGGSAKLTLDRIQKIMDAFPSIPTSDGAKIRAADRALDRKGPCHRENKNSMADALIIETYFETVKGGAPRERFAFVTHNKHDFSQVAGDEKLPHADLASGFSKIRSMYFTNLGLCLNKVNPDFVDEVLYLASYEEPQRDLSEMLEAVDRLTTEVWHNRNMNTQWAIDHGKHRIVTQAEWDAGWAKDKRYGQTHTIDTIWKGALKSRVKARRKLGEGNYGPYSNFEWGMVNGKLSALRWVLGEDWDELYT
jgi:hypothetical protein